MKGLNSLTAAAAVALAACTDRPPQPELEAEGVPEPVVTQTTRQAALQAVPGTGVSGSITVTPFPDSVIFHVEVDDAAPEATLGVRAHAGTCENPGRVEAVLEAVRTGALGNGRSQRALAEADPHRLLDGAHVVAIYAQGAVPEQDRPMACAPIPAMR